LLAAFETARRPVDSQDQVALLEAVDAILTGYARGARFGIRQDEDGLLACGAPGSQLTWMDAKIGDWTVTPRIGKPVEVNALWINALRVGARFSPQWQDEFNKASAAFRARFWNERDGSLFDVIDCDHVPGRNDAAFRANQIFAVGGLPMNLLPRSMAASVVAQVEARLLTPMGLRSLSPEDPAYRSSYLGGVHERDSSYHQGTVWPWLIGPFIEAWIRVRENSSTAKEEARQTFFNPLLSHLNETGLGHVSEIADAEAPHSPRGCPFQAWSLGEMLRIERSILAPSQRPPVGNPRRRSRTAAAIV
jgi:glycogen debranching enzyme